MTAELSSLERLLRRERQIVVVALVSVATLALDIYHVRSGNGHECVRDVAYALGKCKRA